MSATQQEDQKHHQSSGGYSDPGGASPCPQTDSGNPA
jgi:hypothetical protein